MKKIGLGKMIAIAFVLTHGLPVVAAFLEEGSITYQILYYLGMVCFVATLALGVLYLIRCWKTRTRICTKDRSRYQHTQK